MEAMTSMLEGDQWSYLTGMYNTSDESDFMAKLLDNCSNITIDHHHHQQQQQLDVSTNLGLDSSTFWPAGLHDSTMDMALMIHDDNNNDVNECLLLNFPATSNDESYSYLNDSHQVSMDVCLGNEKNIQENEETYAKMPLLQDQAEEGTIKANPKKRSRNSNVEMNKRNVKSRKSALKIDVSGKNNNGEENNNAGLNRQSSSSCSSEEDDSSNTSQDGAGVSPKGLAALNLNGKTRASRGSATDPQSLYARKRRERINERLRTLQNIVPNGTKVDISTMLEEAVEYVKFLQLQIKLLSSDDLWMYSPIAYNGMDIGLDLKINMSSDFGR